MRKSFRHDVDPHNRIIESIKLIGIISTAYSYRGCIQMDHFRGKL